MKKHLQNVSCFWLHYMQCLYAILKFAKNIVMWEKIKKIISMQVKYHYNITEKNNNVLYILIANEMIFSAPYSHSR